MIHICEDGIEFIGKEKDIVNEVFLVLGAIANAIEEDIIDKQTFQELSTDINLVMLLDDEE